jgi:hypothetical protein
MSLTPDRPNPAEFAEGLPDGGTRVRRVNYLGAKAVLTVDGDTGRRVLRTLGEGDTVYTLLDTDMETPAHTDAVADALVAQLEDC